MTPPSINRIQGDDELLDQLGSRSASGTFGGDELSGLLDSWASGIDEGLMVEPMVADESSSAAVSSVASIAAGGDVGVLGAGTADKPAGRYARRGRVGFRAGAAAAVLLGALSVSGMAAAMTSTNVPVLRQLGQVTRGLVFDSPAASTQHQHPSPGARLPAVAGMSSSSSTVPLLRAGGSTQSPSSVFRRPSVTIHPPRTRTSPGSPTSPVTTPPKSTPPTTTPPTTTPPTTTPPTTTPPTTTPPTTTPPTTTPPTTVPPTSPIWRPAPPIRTVNPPVPSQPSAGPSESTTTPSPSAATPSSDASGSGTAS